MALASLNQTILVEVVCDKTLGDGKAREKICAKTEPLAMATVLVG